MRRLTTLIAETIAGQRLRRMPRQPTSPVRERFELDLRRRLIESDVSRRVNRVLRRRLSDRVADVFHEACLGGDFATAEELLVVLEAMHVRRQAAAGERRIDDADVVRVREDLALRKAGRQATAAGTA